MVSELPPITIDMNLKGSNIGYPEQGIQRETAGYVYEGPDAQLFPPVKTSPVPIGKVKGDDVIVCMDIEATGINPWEDRVLVIGLWDLSEPESMITSFWGMDEETVVRDAINWLNEKSPTILVVYNGGYDERHLLTRSMYYLLPMPWYGSCKHHDVMDILKKGALSGVVSSQSPGSVEDWEMYFWDHKKPYTIEECFQGLLDDGTPEKFMLRNRSCVFGEGHLYRLYQYAIGNLEDVEEVFTPIAERTEAVEWGDVTVDCPNCLTRQEFNLSNDFQKCVICGYNIQNPSPDRIQKEYIRPIDLSVIEKGAGKTKTASSKATTAKK